MKHLAPALALCLAANLVLASGTFKNRPANNHVWEDDKPWEEVSVPLGDYPAHVEWRVLDMPNTYRQQVAIDASSLLIGSDGAVRFTLLQRSSQGIENISREGVQCKERSLRSYAFADTVGKRWIESRAAQWKKVEHGDSLRRILLQNLCPDGIKPQDPDAILQNLNKAIP